jgi:ferric-dicitrate binding protein FerR (iron transport regulator)
MNDQNGSSVSSRFRDAKNHAMGDAEAKKKEIELTLEQLEEAIAQIAASSGIPETGMPPRSVVHPSKRGQLSRWFYRLLLVLFTGLAAGLVWWGRHHYGTE